MILHAVGTLRWQLSVSGLDMVFATTYAIVYTPSTPCHESHHLCVDVMLPAFALTIHACAADCV